MALKRRMLPCTWAHMGNMRTGATRFRSICEVHEGTHIKYDNNSIKNVFGSVKPLPNEAKITAAHFPFLFTMAYGSQSVRVRDSKPQSMLKIQECSPKNYRDIYVYLYIFTGRTIKWYYLLKKHYRRAYHQLILLFCYVMFVCLTRLFFAQIIDRTPVIFFFVLFRIYNFSFFVFRLLTTGNRPTKCANYAPD